MCIKMCFYELTIHLECIRQSAHNYPWYTLVQLNSLCLLLSGLVGVVLFPPGGWADIAGWTVEGAGVAAGIGVGEGVGLGAANVAGLFVGDDCGIGGNPKTDEDKSMFLHSTVSNIGTVVETSQFMPWQTATLCTKVYICRIWHMSSGC